MPDSLSPYVMYTASNTINLFRFVSSRKFASLEQVGFSNSLLRVIVPEGTSYRFAAAGWF